MIKEQKDGRLKVDYRFTCERRAPKYDEDYEAWEVDRAMMEARGDLGDFQRGAIYQCASISYVGPDTREPDCELLVRRDTGGWAGNSDYTVLRYHG